MEKSEDNLINQRYCLECQNCSSLRQELLAIESNNMEFRCLNCGHTCEIPYYEKQDESFFIISPKKK